MKIKDIKKLHRGDQVHWTDPYNGICSKDITILSILYEGGIVRIIGMDASYLECFPRELS